MKSYYPKEGDVTRGWCIVDLTEKTLGRACTEIACRLMGKHKPTYTPSVDTGDFVVAINSNKVKLTGNKLQNKIYYSHSGFMGGLKQINAKALMEKDSTQVVMSAVKGMLPRNTLGRKLLKKLKVYSGSEHPHAAQKPQTLEL